jgi:hypothetical protein
MGIVAIFVALMLVRAFKDPAPYDAAFILTAGKVWSAGLDPYGPAFVRFAGTYIPPHMAIWAYPPQWWPIATGLARFDDDTAFLIWKLANIAALLGGGVLLYRVAQKLGAGTPLWAATLFGATLAASDVTRTTFQLGQTSMLILLGFALLMHGLAHGRRVPQVAGLMLLLLKPQFGLLYLLLLGVYPRTRRTALIAVGLTALICVPLLAVFGLDGTIRSAFGLLHNLAGYSAQKWNRPTEVSGLPYVAVQLGLPAISPLLCVVAAAVASVLWMRRSTAARSGAPDLVLFWLVPLATFMLIVPLHLYDFTLVPSFLLFAGLFSRGALACVLGATALCWRTPSLSHRLFMDPSLPLDSIWPMTVVQAGLMTLAGLLLVVAVAIARTGTQAHLDAR